MSKSHVDQKFSISVQYLSSDFCSPRAFIAILSPWANRPLVISSRQQLTR